MVLGLAIVLAGCDREPQTARPAPQEPAAEQVDATPELPEAAEPPETRWDYELARSFESGMGELRGLLVMDDGQIYAAGEDGVRIFDETGKVLNELETPDPARCLTLDSDGNLWVGMGAKVAQYDPKGKLVTSWGKEGRKRGELSYVTGIAVHGINVLVADSGNRVVHRFDLTGDFINGIGERDVEEGVVGIILPSPHLEVHVGEDGLVHVNNAGRLRVETYRLNGELVGHWGEAGLAAEKFSGCCNPTSISFGPEGRVATAEKSIHRVKVYDADRALLAHIGPEHFSRDQTTGLVVAWGPEDRLVVADYGDNRIRVFARSGVE